jgi:hypothetical protein
MANHHVAKLYMESLAAHRRTRGLAGSIIHVGDISDVGYIVESRTFVRSRAPRQRYSMPPRKLSAVAEFPTATASRQTALVPGRRQLSGASWGELPLGPDYSLKLTLDDGKDAEPPYDISLGMMDMGGLSPRYTLPERAIRRRSNNGEYVS